MLEEAERQNQRRGTSCHCGKEVIQECCSWGVNQHGGLRHTLSPGHTAVSVPWVFLRTSFRRTLGLVHLCCKSVICSIISCPTERTRKFTHAFGKYGEDLRECSYYSCIDFSNLCCGDFKTEGRKEEPRLIRAALVGPDFLAFILYSNKHHCL